MLKRSVDTDRKRRGYSRCETRCARVVGGGHRGIVGEQVQRICLGVRLHGEEALTRFTD